MSNFCRRLWGFSLLINSRQTVKKSARSANCYPRLRITELKNLPTKIFQYSDYCLEFVFSSPVQYRPDQIPKVNVPGNQIQHGSHEKAIEQFFCHRQKNDDLIGNGGGKITRQFFVSYRVKG